MLNLDAIIAGTKFDPRSRRFRWVDSGRFVAKTTVTKMTAAFVTEQQQALTGLAGKIYSDQINLTEFQIEATKALKNIYIAQLALGRGGMDKVTPSDFGAIGRMLRSQYYNGTGIDGKQFGLNVLVRDMMAGNVSEAQLRDRLRKFGDSGKQAFWHGRVMASGKAFAIRILGKAEHCAECLAFAAMGKVRADKVVLPTQQCSCGTNCKCSIRFID